MSADLGDGAELDALWAKVLEAWDDDGAHNAVLQHAIDRAKLPELAGRYRALVDDPERGARAKKKMDAIVAAAMHMMLAAKTPERTKTPWTWTVSAGLLFGLVVAFVLYKLLG